MKNLIRQSMIVLLAMISITACKKESKPLDLNLSPVGTLALPNDNEDIALKPTTDASVLFRWQPATSENGTLILYEVAFDKAGGDFSNPVYKIVSDGGGVQTEITLSHKELNKIANKIGISSSSTGTLKWTVIASKGTNVVNGTVSRTLKVDRPAGFAENPTELYLTGSATEGGTDPAKAIKVKKTEDGIFEIYTSLKAGDYILTDHADGSGKQFYVDNGILKEGSTPISVTGNTKAYRLNFDFTSATAKTLEIQSIGLFMSAYNKEIGTLNYIGNSTWEAPSTAIEFFQFSWGRDERYKFVIHSASGVQYVGSTNQNNDAPAGKPASYFYLVPIPNSQWDNTYKFDPSADNKNIKIDVMLTADAYTHKITVL